MIKASLIPLGSHIIILRLGACLPVFEKRLNLVLNFWALENRGGAMKVDI